MKIFSSVGLAVLLSLAELEELFAVEKSAPKLVLLLISKFSVLFLDVSFE